MPIASDTERRQPRQQRSKDRVEAIVEAAERLLLNGGIESITTSAVAEQAGVPIGSVYRYFADVDAVLAAVFDRAMAASEAKSAEAILKLETVTARNVIETYTLAHLAYHQSNPEFARVWFGGGFSVAVHERVKRADFIWADRLVRASTAAGMVSGDAPVYGARLIARLSNRAIEFALTEGMSAIEQRNLLLEYLEMVITYVDRFTTEAGRRGVPVEQFLAGFGRVDETG